MKRLSTALGIAALALPPLAGGAGAAQPSLRLLALIPPRVRGAHFGSGERVTVTLVAGKTRRGTTTRASRTGAFTIAFKALSDEDRCSGPVSLVAVGARGDRAAYTLTPASCPTPSETVTGGSKLLPPPPYTK